MITTILGGIAASTWARAILRYGAIAVAIVLFLLSIRRTGERAGRIPEHKINRLDELIQGNWKPENPG